MLHFDYLECSTCHSPKSTKSIVFSFSYREGNTKKVLTYNDLKERICRHKKYHIAHRYEQRPLGCIAGIVRLLY